MMGRGRYILDIDKTPLRCDDLTEWAMWFQRADRIVKRSIDGDVTVSTVFLGLDHSFNLFEGRPVLFETMVFGGQFDGDQRRYHTWHEALAGHDAECARVGVKP